MSNVDLMPKSSTSLDCGSCR